MARLPDDLTFEAWVTFVFDHPVPENSEPIWHWAVDADWWNEGADPARTTHYLTRLFGAPLNILAPFSDAQIEQGLNFVVSSGCSGHFVAALGDTVPLENRLRLIEAFYTLFEQFYAPRCTPHLGHLSETGSPLNMTCYMWWDIIPLYAALHSDLDAACLAVMAHTLKLPSAACQESALHGLGHWQHAYPEQVVGVIDRYLARNPDLRPELNRYALSARQGCVL